VLVVVVEGIALVVGACVVVVVVVLLLLLLLVVETLVLRVVRVALATTVRDVLPVLD
jgi:hypothetical protein